MKDSARYAKIVAWSQEDGCYIGRAPGLIHGGVHGSDERAVFSDLCVAVEEAIELYREDGKELPPPTVGAAEVIETYTEERIREFEATNTISARAEQRVQEYLEKRVKK